MELNYIYKFDFNKLRSSRLEQGILKCSSSTCLSACEIVSKRDSLLLDQIKKIKCDETHLEEILVVFDFSSFIKDKHKMVELLDIDLISLEINILNQKKKTHEKKTIYVRDFLKSNSMSKDCQIYYINNNALDKFGNNLYEKLSNRVFLDFDKSKTVLSKLYSYSGTLCSDCVLLNNISFKPGELVIVNDKFDNKPIITNCITMISSNLIYDKIKQIKKKYLPNFIKRVEQDASQEEKVLKELFARTACMELDSYYNSLNLFNNAVSNEHIKEMLVLYHEIPKDTIFSFKNGVSDIVARFEEKVKKEKEVKWERITAKDFPFFLNLFDGEGLISSEFCSEIRNELHKELGSDAYDASNSFQIRLPYVKGMVHSCNIQKFFNDKGITSIPASITIDKKDYDISKVKIVLTASQFKMEKFLKHKSGVNPVDFYVNYLNDYNYPFGIVSADKGENASGKDEYCSLEYQFISTLPLKVDTLIKLKNSVMGRTDLLCSKENIISSLKTNYESLSDEELNDKCNKIKQEMDMFNLSPEFYYGTKKYRERKRSIYNKMKGDALFSKFNVHGYRRYLSSDLLEFLYYIADVKHPILMNANDYYLPSNHPINTSAVFLRSPHYSRNEIVFLNKLIADKNDEREIYLGHLTGVVMVNPRSLTSERLGGADYDGDTVVIVTEKLILDEVKRNIVDYSNSSIKYAYLPFKIPSLNGNESLVYTEKEHRLECLQNTFASRIGEISNNALIEAAFAYNDSNSNLDDYNRIVEFTIISGIEIDSAKSGKKPDLADYEKIKYKKNKISKEIYNCLNLYLEAKKAYDKDSSITKALNLVDELNHLIDNETFYENNHFGSNVLDALYIMNEIKPPHKKEIKSALKFDKNDYSYTNEYAKCLAIIRTYRDCSFFINRVLSNKAKEANQNKQDIIYSQIEEILNDRISINELLDCMTIDNLLAAELLVKYIESDKKYHFLTDLNERKEFIKTLFPKLDDSKIIDIFTDFNHDGFRLLFLYLNYLKREITTCQLSMDFENDNLSEKLNDTITEDYKRYVDEYHKYLNGFLDPNLDPEEIYRKLLDYLEKEIKDIEFGDIINSIDIYNSPMMFDLFFSKLKEKLEGDSNVI